MLLIGLFLAVPSLAAKRPPNIVVLLADDLGYGDLGVMGATDVQTPNIDALFAAGMRFHQAYVSYPACSPSRASLLTGRHPMRMGFSGNPNHVIPTEPGNLLGLGRDEVTIATLLKQKGYRTGLFGKWHLGVQQPNHPLNRGFDEFYGFLGPLHRYFDLGNQAYPDGLMRGHDRIKETRYLTDAIAEESADFIGRHREEPFFLYVAFSAVHTPLMYDRDPGARANIPLAGTDDIAENRRMLANMIEGLDRGVGTVLDTLASTGLLENTLVVFSNDNGGPAESGAYSNRPLRGWKGDLWEGGIRVPMAVGWNGRIPRGSSYPHPVTLTDLFATFAAVADLELPAGREYDSRDLGAALFSAGKEAVHGEAPLFWDAFGQGAVRRGDWKLVMQGGKPLGLYNIPADPGENDNLLDTAPERARKLLRMHRQWRERQPPPRFKWVGPERYSEWEKANGRPW